LQERLDSRIQASHRQLEDDIKRQGNKLKDDIKRHGNKLEAQLGEIMAMLLIGAPGNLKGEQLETFYKESDGNASDESGETPKECIGMVHTATESLAEEFLGSNKGARLNVDVKSEPLEGSGMQAIERMRY
jgi:hypothetical protein